MNEDRSPPPEKPSQLHPGGRWLDRLLSLVRPRGGASIRDDLEDALAHSYPTEEFTAKERTLLRNVLALRERRVQDAMVPRADIIAIHEDASLGEVLNVFRTAGHSRLPVYGETLDDPRGMVHIRDFLDHLAARAEAGPSRRSARPSARKLTSLAGIDLTLPLSSAGILRPVLYVPPSMPALDLLVRMQASRTHMALVVDEYGGTDGLVSMEDVVELVVGDIEDEHDLDAGPMIAPSDDGTFIADARAPLEDVAQVIGVDIASSDLAEEVDTIGGLLVLMTGRLPARGELIRGPHNLEFEVLDADPRRLKRLRIHVQPAEAPAPRRRPLRRDASASDPVAEKDLPGDAGPAVAAGSDGDGGEPAARAASAAEASPVSASAEPARAPVATGGDTPEPAGEAPAPRMDKAS